MRVVLRTGGPLVAKVDKTIIECMEERRMNQKTPLFRRKQPCMVVERARPHTVAVTMGGRVASNYL